ncbi:MAG TPA: type II toxin-antitoxin system Phd/YefM family antitoxin [Terriglobales bacterium]|nr:type II toxin-antitoxin system Phd/YefM family antitoxin [Terriglobales bacterium]
METIAISKFKATCLAVVEEVRRTKRPVVITRFGRPVAELVPLQPRRASKNWLGAMAGTATLHGDIVGPISSANDWEAARQ